jgi:cytochrome c oxidase assembly protein subunit 15
MGLIYFVRFVYFLIKNKIPKEWVGRLFSIVVLIGLQGLMGWYMVKSGLVDVPRVSQYRLTAHLGLALIIFALMLWFAMDFLRGDSRVYHASSGYLKSTAAVLIIVLIMMLSGGFVAGTKAGYIINTFPTMNGQWLPDGLLGIQPIWLNVFENPITIQFIHRATAVLVFFSVIISFCIALKQRFKTMNFTVVFVMLVQVNLGISALVMKVPVVLGAAHQAGAVALLSAALYVAHIARKSSS